MDNSNAVDKLLKKYISEKCSRQELEELLLLFQNEDADLSKKLEEIWYLELNSKFPIQETDLSARDVLTSSYNLKKELREKRNRRIVILAGITTIAAFFCVVLLLRFLGSTSNTSSVKAVAASYTDRITQPGQRTSVKLPDGSLVIMNSASKLSVINSFGNSFREVSLKGEAYFRIAKDSLHPFTISTSHLNVSVLGTSFNIKSFDNENSIQVSVTSGKVRVKLLGDTTSMEYYLTLDQQLVYDKTTHSIRIRKVNAKNYCGWTDGKLIFNRTPFMEVARTLERLYGIKVVVQNPRLRNALVSGRHNNESIQSVAQSFKVTFNTEYSIKSDTLFFTEYSNK